MTSRGVGLVDMLYIRFLCALKIHLASQLVEKLPRLQVPGMHIYAYACMFICIHIYG